MAVATLAVLGCSRENMKDSRRDGMEEVELNLSKECLHAEWRIAGREKANLFSIACGKRAGA